MADIAKIDGFDIPAAGATIASGSYTGDDNVNRAIAHGLGVIPKAVFITNEDGGDFVWFRMFDSDNGEWYAIDVIGGNISQETVTAMDATNFYVGKAAGKEDETANDLNDVYHWVAIG